MPDFLDTAYEILPVILLCMAGSVFGSFSCGLLMTATDEKKQIFRDEIAFFSLGLALLLFFVAFLASLDFFLDFRWTLLGATLIISFVLGFLIFQLITGALMNLHAMKYRRNPLVKEIIRYCRDQNIVGIQCYSNCVRYFRALENLDYCKPKTITKEEKITYAAAQDLRPLSWQAYDYPASLAGVLEFADRSYPNLPNVGVFALALAKGIGGCKVAKHKTEIKISGPNNKAAQTNITYQDHFVYKTRVRNALAWGSFLRKFQEAKHQKTKERLQKRAQKKTEKKAEEENPSNRWV